MTLRTQAILAIIFSAIGEALFLYTWRGGLDDSMLAVISLVILIPSVLWLLILMFVILRRMY